MNDTLNNQGETMGNPTIANPTITEPAAKPTPTAVIEAPQEPMIVTVLHQIIDTRVRAALEERTPSGNALGEKIQDIVNEELVNHNIDYDHDDIERRLEKLEEENDVEEAIDDYDFNDKFNHYFDYGNGERKVRDIVDEKLNEDLEDTVKRHVADYIESGEGQMAIDRGIKRALEAMLRAL